MTASAGNGGKEMEQTHEKQTHMQRALAVALRIISTAEQFLLLYSTVSTVETETALAAIRAARAVLTLTHSAVSSRQKSS